MDSKPIIYGNAIRESKVLVLVFPVLNFFFFFFQIMYLYICVVLSRLLSRLSVGYLLVRTGGYFAVSVSILLLLVSYAMSHESGC